MKFDIHLNAARFEFERVKVPCARCGTDLNAPTAPDHDEISWEDGTSEFVCLVCMEEVEETIEEAKRCE